MITVENQKFYHIQRGKVPPGGHRWNIGSKKYWGREMNFVTKAAFEQDYGFSLPIPKQPGDWEKFDSFTWLFWEMINFFKTGKKDPRFAPYYHYDPKEAFKECYRVVHAQSYVLREMVFEEVRKELNKELPSRYTGLWVIKDNLDDLQYWYRTLGATDNSTIITLSLTGKVHQGNLAYTPDGTYSVDVLRKKALKYWNTEPGRKANKGFDERFEYLFEGHATVLDVTTPQEIGVKLNEINTVDLTNVERPGYNPDYTWDMTEEIV